MCSLKIATELHGVEPIGEHGQARSPRGCLEWMSGMIAKDAPHLTERVVFDFLGIHEPHH